MGGNNGTEKMILVTAPLMPKLDRYIEELKKIWESGWITNHGPECGEFQHRLEDLFGDKVELYVNGHMALDVALKSLDLKGEVITTPFTFGSTVHALVMNGLTPVFADINEADYTINADQIESLITDKTSAILAVHVYGCLCNVGKIEEIAKKYHLKVIYDAAHAFGVTQNGRSIARYGDISMFSFHATKVFNSVEGGALVYHDASYAAKLRSLKNFGIKDEEHVPMIGLNAKMNEFAAAMGICNLELFQEAVDRRRMITEQYREAVCGLKGIRTLEYDFFGQKGIAYNYAYMPVAVDAAAAGYTRDELYRYLKQKKIIARKYFYPIVSDYECYRGVFDSSRTPVAKKAGEQILTLPISASMTQEDTQRCCQALREMAKRVGK